MKCQYREKPHSPHGLFKEPISENTSPGGRSLNEYRMWIESVVIWGTTWHLCTAGTEYSQEVIARIADVPGNKSASLHDLLGF